MDEWNSDAYHETLWDIWGVIWRALSKSKQRKSRKRLWKKGKPWAYSYKEVITGIAGKV